MIPPLQILYYNAIEQQEKQETFLIWIVYFKYIHSYFVFFFVSHIDKTFKTPDPVYSIIIIFTINSKRKLKNISKKMYWQKHVCFMDIKRLSSLHDDNNGWTVGWMTGWIYEFSSLVCLTRHLVFPFPDIKIIFVP